MIVLCGFPLSNYYNKVKMALLEKGIAFTERRADLTASYQLFLLDPNGVKVELNFAASEAAGRKAELMRADLA